MKSQWFADPNPVSDYDLDHSRKLLVFLSSQRRRKLSRNPYATFFAHIG